MARKHRYSTWPVFSRFSQLFIYLDFTVFLIVLWESFYWKFFCFCKNSSTIKTTFRFLPSFLFTSVFLLNNKMLLCIYDFWNPLSFIENTKGQQTDPALLQNLFSFISHEVRLQKYWIIFRLEPIVQEILSYVLMQSLSSFMNGQIEIHGGSWSVSFHLFTINLVVMLQLSHHTTVSQPTIALMLPAWTTLKMHFLTNSPLFDRK